MSDHLDRHLNIENSLVAKLKTFSLLRDAGEAVIASGYKMVDEIKDSIKAPTLSFLAV
jgi:UDP-N-acetylmuramyl tripeptide synthase